MAGDNGGMVGRSSHTPVEFFVIIGQQLYDFLKTVIQDFFRL